MFQYYLINKNAMPDLRMQSLYAWCREVINRPLSYQGQSDHLRSLQLRRNDLIATSRVIPCGSGSVLCMTTIFELDVANYAGV